MRLKVTNMICGGSSCFVKGTKVLTFNGYKNIEENQGFNSVRYYKDYVPILRSQRSDYAFPLQRQNRQPGFEYVMKPVPTSECGKKCPKLEDKVALITGGDSGIGRAVAYDFVKQGASVAIIYYDEQV